jgi:hypothetical protein
MKALLLSALGLVVACTFPSRSSQYACETTADCEAGRTCDSDGYCVKASVDGGGDTGDSTFDAAIVSTDGGPTPDADMLAMKCPAAGYTYAAAPGGYYKVVATGASWTAAQASCAADVAGSTHLIVLSSSAEVSFMATNLGWIGLSDRAVENHFVTVTTETGDQRPWASGQPDNGSGSEDCAQMKSGGQLDDDQCGNSHRYVCECDGRMPTP